MTVAEMKTVEVKHQIRGYARTLYTNYRARMLTSGVSLPSWNQASAVVRREFLRDARTAFGY